MKLSKIKYLSKEFGSAFWPMASTGIGIVLIMEGANGLKTYQNHDFGWFAFPVSAPEFIIGAFIAGTLFIVSGVWLGIKLARAARKRRHNTNQQ